MEKEKKNSLSSENKDKNKRMIRYDENGNPIPPKRRPVRYDENEDMVYSKKNLSQTDKSGNLMFEIGETLDTEAYENEPNVELSTEELDRTELGSFKNKKKNISGIVFSVLQALISVMFFGLLIVLDMLPNKFLIVIAVILLVLLAFTILSQCSKSGKKVGLCFSIIIILLFSVASVYIWKAHDVIDEVTTNAPTTKLSDVSIIVMTDSPAQGLNDLKGKDFGVQKVIDRENTELTLQELESKLSDSVETIDYESLKSQVQALYNGDVDAIIINEVYRGLILEDFPTFDQDTRVLDGFTHVKEVEERSKVDVNVETEAFTIYLSGNDSFGTVNLEDGRSDVNIIATINPTTKQILLTSTPRDYYVELPFGPGCYDKLTHAGLYGIETSMETLENLYDVEIDYYVRVNFSGFKDIVDALGGVEVNSQFAFTSATGMYFNEGINYLDGDAALTFVRERKAFADGDFQRGRNQMAMIEAIANKIFSPSILMNYLDLMDSLSTCFITDMPREKINDLVKMQLNDGAEWTILSNSVTGYGSARSTYSGGSELLSCVDPDQGDVDLAKELILKCINGEKVVVPDKEAAGVYTGSNLGSVGRNNVTESSMIYSQMPSTNSSMIIDDTSEISGSNMSNSSYAEDSSMGNSSEEIEDSVSDNSDQENQDSANSGTENSNAESSSTDIPSTDSSATEDSTESVPNGGSDSVPEGSSVESLPELNSPDMEGNGDSNIG